jgi:CBS domain-containing protein
MAVDSLVASGHVSFESAVTHVCVPVPRASPDDRVETLRQVLVERDFESASHVVVCEGDTFLGILRIEDLLAAAGGASVASLMDREVKRSRLGARFVMESPPCP